MAGSAKARTIFAVSFERRPKLLHAVSTELGIWVISSPKAGQADRMPFYERNTLASFGGRNVHEHIPVLTWAERRAKCYLTPFCRDPSSVAEGQFDHNRCYAFVSGHIEIGQVGNPHVPPIGMQFAFGAEHFRRFAAIQRLRSRVGREGIWTYEHKSWWHISRRSCSGRSLSSRSDRRGFASRGHAESAWPRLAAASGARRPS